MEKEEKFIVRHAKLSDINSIYALGSKFDDSLKASRRRNMHFHEKKEFKEFIKSPKCNILLVACIKKKVVGFLYAKILSYDWCLLDDVAVEANYQHEGIGSELLKEFYKILKQRKIDYVQILEEIHHKQTRKFWKDKGFKEEKTFVWADRMLKANQHERKIKAKKKQKK